MNTIDDWKMMQTTSLLSQKIHFIWCFITERLWEVACSPVFATQMWGPGHTQAFLSCLAGNLVEGEISWRSRSRLLKISLPECSPDWIQSLGQLWYLSKPQEQKVVCELKQSDRIEWGIFHSQRKIFLKLVSDPAWSTLMSRTLPRNCYASSF